MQKLLLFILLFSASLLGNAQQSPTEQAQPIVHEGKLLYKSEMASWHGTDLFVEKYKTPTDIGGYISYTEGSYTKCVFYSKAENPSVLGTITFDSTFNIHNAVVDLGKRSLLPVEAGLRIMRETAINLMESDTFFKSYKNTNFNIIPLIHDGEKRVYVLTGPQVSDVVIFGNDYLITFNEQNEVTSKKQLHKNILPMSYGAKKDKDKEPFGAMHTHLPETGDFITATDICTLMLYSKFANWKTHVVVSSKYMNNWDCETNSLVVIPMETVEKINKDQEKKEKKQRKKEKKTPPKKE